MGVHPGGATSRPACWLPHGPRRSQFGSQDSEPDMGAWAWGPLAVPSEAYCSTEALRQPPAGPTLDRTALWRGPAKRGTGKSWKAVAFITGRFESPVKGKHAFQPQRHNWPHSRTRGNSGLCPWASFIPVQFPEKSQGFCGGSLGRSQGPAPLHLRLTCGTASVTCPGDGRGQTCC